MPKSTDCIFHGNHTSTQNIYSTCEALKMLRIIKCKPKLILNLEDLTVLKRSHDLFNNVKIGQDQPRLKVKHILFYGGCSHFGQVT